MVPQSQMKGRITGILLFFIFYAHSHFIPQFGDSEWLCSFASGTANNKGPVNGKAFDWIIHIQILKYCFIQRLLWFYSNPRAFISLLFRNSSLLELPHLNLPQHPANCCSSYCNFCRELVCQGAAQWQHNSLLTCSRVLLQRRAGACWCFSPSRRSAFFNINVENYEGIAMVNLKRFENNCRNIEN